MLSTLAWSKVLQAPKVHYKKNSHFIYSNIVAVVFVRFIFCFFLLHYEKKFQYQ